MMIDQTILSDQGTGEWHRADLNLRQMTAGQPLAARITRAASKQTYYTIRLLADQERIQDAYRAYAYFRWVDDRLDQDMPEKAERTAFVQRQQALIERVYMGGLLANLTLEERMVIDLIHSNPEPDSGLQAYLRNMMAVMAFDASRRGRLISQQELDTYSRLLATGVTEALHYFIGHYQFSPHDDSRYLAVTGAHITHMLRDTAEDIAAGYFNISREFLNARGISPQDITSAPYRTWVKERVLLARSYFAAGRDYLARVENWRCRLAGYAYIARFEWVLNTIERDEFYLRPAYPERKSLKSGLLVGGSALTMLMKGLL